VTETADVYELVVERHRRASTIVTSNREPAEWLAAMADPLLAQSAIGMLASGAHPLDRQGRVLPPPNAARPHAAQRPGAGRSTNTAEVAMIQSNPVRGGAEAVPCSWRDAGPFTLASDTPDFAHAHDT
jgi:hypothetical protein